MISVCNLERFATHDGDGIRSVVFFQGCPLRCPWCANPESQVIAQQLMYDELACIQCHSCVNVCPNNAITFHDKTLHWSQSQCKQCHACETECLQNAISFCGERRSIHDIMSEVMKDKAYYDTSNGGITISGGEPFVQFDQFLSLLKQCKKEQLHVTVETCGQYPLYQLEEAYPYIDTFYFDIKHIDPTIYQTTVHGDLKQVEENLHYLVSKDPTRVVFRTPVIPGFNYNTSTLYQILDMAKDMHVKEVHFLPYHTLALGKYKKMLLDYPWSTTSLKPNDLEPYKIYASQIGVSFKIGG